MTHHQTSGPVSRRAALAGLGAGGLGLALTAATRPAAAQDTTPADAAGSPLVGMWQWNSFPESPEPANFAIFHADGTYAEWQPVAGEAIGIWRMTGERTFDLLFIFPDTDPSLEGFAPGTATFTIAGELDETGNALTATGTIGVRDPGGVHLVDVPWTRPATRVTFETNPSTGSIPATPVAATPSA